MGTRVAWSLLVLALASASYAWILALPLTGIDAIPTIAAAHVDRVTELPSVLGRELRGGAQQGGAYYRPLTLLTYGIESLLWEWNALGHHATDLAFHALAALAVFWMARLAFAQGVLGAFAVVAIFLLHPVVNEVVPAVSRRQEPLLVAGLALALIGAARVPARRGWSLLLLGSAASVCSVERGLVVPGIVFAYLLFQRQDPAAPGARLRSALLGTAPVLAVALGFYALRAALFGTGGVFFEPARAARIFARYLLELVYPQQLVDLQMPGSALGALGWLAAAVAVTAAGSSIFLHSKRKGALLFALAWIFGYGLLFSIAGQGNSWYPYSAVPALALALVVSASEGFANVTERGATRRQGALALVLIAGILAPLVATSPVLGRYRAWEVAGGLSDRFLVELGRLAGELPADTVPVVINLPGHYRESDSELRVTRSAAILWPRSIEVWREVQGIERPIVVLGAAGFVGSVTRPTIEFEGDHRVAIGFEAGASAYEAPDRGGSTIEPLPPSRGRGFEFPLEPAPGGRRHAVFVFDGVHLAPLARNR